MDLLVLPGTTKTSAAQSRERAFSLLPYVDNLRIYYPSSIVRELNSPHVILGQADSLSHVSDYLKRTDNAQGAIVFFSSPSKKQIEQTVTLAEQIPLLVIAPAAAVKSLKGDSFVRVVDEERAVHNAIKAFIDTVSRGS